jgi:CBS domain-containing protein
MSGKSAFFDFLQSIEPFSLLSEHQLQEIASHLSPSHYHPRMTLFVQDTTIITHIILLHQGRLEYTLSEQGQTVTSQTLQEKSVYGALSLLFNNGLSIGTVRTLEDVVLLHIPKEIFLQLCSKHEDFAAYFANQFSRKLIQGPYLDYLSRKSKSSQDISGPFFLSKPVGSILSPNFSTCLPETSIQEAAQKITAADHNAVLVLDSRGQALGIVTDHDLRNQVIIQGVSRQTAVQDIMSSPLIAVRDQTLVYEAVLCMMQNRIKQLAVENETGVCGLLSEQEIFLAQGLSPIFIMHQIKTAQDVQQLQNIHAKKPYLIKSLIDSGAKAEHLTGLITSMSDAILQRLVEFALQELGPAPVEFAFIILGSEGRKEQTLKTDQDNAIVFADRPGQDLQEVQGYFLRLGEKVCAWLDQVGFAYCENDIMAQNPDWCQPLKQWQEYFKSWIYKAEGQDLLQACIFFDFRLGYGQQALVNELKDFLFRTLEDWGPFFRHMAKNALYFELPLDFFGSFILQSNEQKEKGLDMKAPMRLVVDFARIYALQLQTPQTNTQERLAQIHNASILKKGEYEELHYAYSFLMHLRLTHQANMVIDQNKSATNLLPPENLTHIERRALKEAFKRIKAAQDRLRTTFTALPG